MNGAPPPHVAGEYLFVYGTLRGGGGAAGKLRGCAFLGTACVAGALYDVNGEYPTLVPDGSGSVVGEVWRCPAAVLRRLDRYEGLAAGLYSRVRVRAGEHDCWTYVAGPALAEVLIPERRIASGCWLTHLRRDSAG
ncbi:MAG TPA: gamma-glutamylcyclotransferase family protein [Longimicrobiaceae bacterium]|nr:gamma-glutamylcyclotransferase family protein [Longimicrobiaceae bacterium]